MDKATLIELGAIWDEAHAISLLAERIKALQHRIVLVREHNDDDEELEGALDTMQDACTNMESEFEALSTGLDELQEAVDFGELEAA